MSSVRVRHPAPLLEPAGADPRRHERVPGARAAVLRHLRRPARRCARAGGHEVVLVSSSEQGGGWRTLRKYARLARSARAAARSRRPDVVWGHYLVPTGRSRAARRGPPACRTRSPHTAPTSPTPSARRASARRPAKAVADACAVFAVSDELGARLDAVAGPLGERLHIISAGVDTDAFADGDRGSRSPRSAGRRRAAHRSRRQPRAGQEPARLLEAFASRARHVGRRCAGARRRRPAARRARGARRELGVAEHVRFAGGATPGEVPRWLRACDVACLVSEREGFGLAAIEALACGRPVVVSRAVPVGRARSTEGVTGALCDAERHRGHRRRARARRAPDARARARAAPPSPTRWRARQRARGRRARGLR